jgi:hypothetical protein
VEFNEIYNAGARGAQGDGIDIKGGLSNVVIRGNNIHSLNFPGSIRAIVSQGQLNGTKGTNLVIERNFIHDCLAMSSAAIDIVDSWGIPQGVVIRNNIIARIDGPGSSGLPPGGIGIATTQDQVLIANNTIYNCKGFAVSTGYTSSSVKLRNNLILNNNGSGAQVSLVKAVLDSDWNAYNFSWGFAGEGSHSLALTQTEVAASVINPSLMDFHLPVGSRLVDVGEIQPGFTNDFAGVVRGTKWDIGAHELAPGAPQPPKNLRVIP